MKIPAHLVITLIYLSIFPLFADAKPTTPTINLFSEGKDGEQGLQITLKQKKFKGANTNKVEFKVHIINRLLEEVFIEVTNLEKANISISSDSGGMGSGISSIGFPDNIPLLKRLHAGSKLDDGTIVTCGCGSVTINQWADLDLSSWVGAECSLSFTVSGFYRSSGKQFNETITLKFNIEKPKK